VTLLEYAFHGDPRRADANPIWLAGDSGPYVALTFPRNRFATDVTISYESSEDCTTWLPVSPIGNGVGSVDFETEVRTAYMLATSPRFFVRVRVQVQ
jgi:hypothetical protein